MTHITQDIWSNIVKKEPSSAKTAIIALGLSFLVSAPALAENCAPGTQCIRANASGAPDDSGDYIAQCAGRYADFIVPEANIPADYAGPYFSLSQDFPDSAPTGGDRPWEAYDFSASKDAADKYLFALRDYAFAGMIEADFVPSKNSTRAWYHVPLMNYGRGAREMVHGLTKERTLGPPELGLKNYVSNYAVGFYNDVGAATFGGVFADTNNPDVSQSRFANGSMVFKILFSTATPDDFQDPSTYILEGSPEWQAAVGGGTLTTVRLLQMDVAVRDDRAKPSGWVFGTFVYDRDATDPVAWNRLRPVGLAWGDDPGVTPEMVAKGTKLEEGIVSDLVPTYAAGHLGWAGRVNGPVDNPASSCISCHGTAQYPVAAIMLPTSACDTDEKKLWYFRNLTLGEAFGGVDHDTCEPIVISPPPVSLDFSLQMQVAIQNLLDKGDINTCTPAAPRLMLEGKSPLREAPRIQR